MKTRTSVGAQDFDDEELDFDFEEFDKEFEEAEANALQKDKKKEFYVKKADLIAEIQKYQDSKKNDPNGKGKISEELRSHDHEDLHKILTPSEILWIYLQRRFRVRSYNPLHHSLPRPHRSHASKVQSLQLSYADCIQCIQTEDQE